MSTPSPVKVRARGRGFGSLVRVELDESLHARLRALVRDEASSAARALEILLAHRAVLCPEFFDFFRREGVRRRRGAERERRLEPSQELVLEQEPVRPRASTAPTRFLSASRAIRLLISRKVPRRLSKTRGRWS